LTYDDEREALALARQAGEAVESLIAQLIVAFEEESRSIDEERARNEASRRD
jgi:hypothetical protein